MPEMGYTVVKTTPVDEQTQLPSEPGAINGGMYRRSAETPSVPVLTIDVNSVDDALSEIEAAGGRVLRSRTGIPGMGAFAYFIDPEGNALGLWENA
jgi:predicted enzyme related to lactoylglutathione lyase